MGLRELLVETSKVFDGMGIGYALIGGYAGAVYGSPYATSDIDFVISEEGAGIELFDELKKVGWVPTEDYKDIQELLSFGQFYHKDLGFPMHIFSEVPGFRIREGIEISETRIDETSIKICSPEDLVIMRLAGWSDEDKLKAVALAKATELDMDYLRKRAKEEGVGERLDWLLEEVSE